MRGETEVSEFVAAMLATLNKPRNAAKGPWSGMTLLQLCALLGEERHEVDRELLARHLPGGIDWERLAAELADEAVCCMFLWQHARARAK